MMGCMQMMAGDMMWAVYLVWLLVVVLLLLGVTALVKYLFFSGRRRHD